MDKSAPAESTARESRFPSLVVGDRLAQNAQVLACRVGDDVVLFDTERGRYYGLNEVGAAIFDLAKDDRRLGEIHDELTARYQADPALLWSDLVAFSGQMLALGVLRRAG